MGYTRTTDADCIPIVWMNFAAQAKTSFTLWFRGTVLKELQQQDPLAFPKSFDYLPQFIDDLYNLKLTRVQDTNTWHAGIVGNQLHHSPGEVRHLNQIAQATRSLGIQLQVTPGDILRLHAQAPVPVTLMDELLQVLRCTHNFC